MAAPVADSYSCASGGVIAAGRSLNQFDAVALLSDDGNGPYLTPGQTMIVDLHGSGGSNLVQGLQYQGECPARMSYSTDASFHFATVRTYAADQTALRPVDKGGANGARESQWLGYSDTPTADVNRMTERRLDAMLVWADANVPNINPAKRVITGGSMGGWGSLRFGMRRPTKFSAIYPDRPRWRYGATIGQVAISSWDNGMSSVLVASAPDITSADGGGSVADYMDMTTYAGNTAHKIPWVGWCVGRQDGYVQFADHVDAVVAMRAAKRGFAFAWNNGNHSSGSILSEITQSYPFGLFEIEKGYPLFTAHSGDSDPAVDLVGGINIGLSFRSVIESPSGWSCEVTSILGARTVTVEPISDVFVAPRTPQVVTIPAANTWVSVGFSA